MLHLGGGGRNERTERSNAGHLDVVSGESQAGSEFNPAQKSQNNANLNCSPREKAAIRGDQRGVLYLSVGFRYFSRFQHSL